MTRNLLLGLAAMAMTQPVVSTARTGTILHTPR